jgi:hypothetical protein
MKTEKAEGDDEKTCDEGMIHNESVPEEVIYHLKSS